MSIGWIVVLGLVVLALGALISVTTVRIAWGKPGDPVFRLVIVWPSGPVTYEWPRKKP